jgi:hypothetical protein
MTWCSTSCARRRCREHGDHIVVGVEDVDEREHNHHVVVAAGHDERAVVSKGEAGYVVVIGTEGAGDATRRERDHVHALNMTTARRWVS